ncbi:DUF4224 domain-containing protein [Candidimonas sp. SYP-B2681]|uniref:DUF4224 domain-containing protein n=1 Tax=Candidimonas sp. SYP-B2681 TaxID=2497686 RepID=UPI000F8674ED|nr:DUF4224 domain-containing protein [Candidimonas sp. SYP-B2681]
MPNMAEFFLTDEEICILTGISTGRDGRRREELQCEHLRKQGIAFYINARGKPVVVRESLLPYKATPATKPSWQPKVLEPESLQRARRTPPR